MSNKRESPKQPDGHAGYLDESGRLVLGSHKVAAERSLEELVAEIAAAERQAQNCPICGCAPQLEQYDFFRYGCSSCCLRGSSHDDEPAARSIWNRLRVEPASAPEDEHGRLVLAGEDVPTEVIS